MGMSPLRSFEFTLAVVGTLATLLALISIPGSLIFLLSKNAWLADHLISTGLEHHHGERPELEPLEDSLEQAAHEAALAAARAG